jgi:hypothetical protein
MNRVRYPYIPEGLVIFEPVRRLPSRPTTAEMCGTLPNALYKVLPLRYARALVERGEMMWSTLTFFQNELDPTRGDPHEGSHRYFPVTGLHVTRHERNGRPDHAQFILPGHGSQIKAFKCHHIFVYSTTFDPSLAIGDAVSRACVEVYDPAIFLQRIARGVATHRKARLDRLIHGEVRYWSPEDPPREIWAFPHLLTMHQHQSHSDDREYRFAFGTRSDVFDFEHVFGLVVPPGYVFPRIELDAQVHRMKLHLGTLTDCCRLRA